VAVAALALGLAGCDEGPTKPDLRGVYISPDSTSLVAGGQLTLTASVNGFDADSLSWYVNDEYGGSFAYGTITSDGIFTAPTITPEDPVVVVKAVSAADTNYWAQAKILIVSTILLSPDSTAIKPLGEVPFTAEVLGLQETRLVWYVNDRVGGDQISGTISSEGVYSAPMFIPVDPVIIVKAVSAADTNYSAQAKVRIVHSLSVEMEDYESSEGVSIIIKSCSAASGGQAVDGCDADFEALYYRVTFEYSGVYSVVLRAAASKLVHRYSRITVRDSGPGGEDQVADFDIEGRGIG
jgi:hypothetical protein